MTIFSRIYDRETKDRWHVNSNDLSLSTGRELDSDAPQIRDKNMPDNTIILIAATPHPISYTRAAKETVVQDELSPTTLLANSVSTTPIPFWQSLYGCKIWHSATPLTTMRTLLQSSILMTQVTSSRSQVLPLVILSLGYELSSLLRSALCKWQLVQLYNHLYAYRLSFLRQWWMLYVVPVDLDSSRQV